MLPSTFWKALKNQESEPPDHGPGLELQRHQGGISRLTPAQIVDKNRGKVNQGQAKAPQW
jgi:hypothetical protein